MVAAPLLLIRLPGNLGQDFYFLFGVWSVCVCSKSFRPEEPIKRIASPRVEAVRDSIAFKATAFIPGPLRISPVALLGGTIPLDVDLELYSKALRSSVRVGSLVE